MMNRRSFLKFLGIGTAAAAAAGVTPSMLEGFVPDPERLLWRPGEKTLILPPEKTFSLYSMEDLQALGLAMGVLTFYDPRGRERLSRFDAQQPHEVDKLAVLSDQEIRLAIATGQDLQQAMQPLGIPLGARRGAYDGQRGATMFTDRGSMRIGAKARLPRRDVLEDRYRAESLVHGHNLLAGDGRYAGMTTAVSTDRGMVTVTDKRF